MDAAGCFIEHITSGQYFRLFTFQLKAVFPFKDVAKNEPRMSMFGRSRARWEGQFKNGHVPAVEAHRRKVPIIDAVYGGCSVRFRTIQHNKSQARQPHLKKLSSMFHQTRIASALVSLIDPYCV